jgi:hypothetical protein
MAEVWPLWNGARYLRRVNDWLDNASDGPRSRRRKIVKQFVKERSKFWA